jgi:hypothetical protein
MKNIIMILMAAIFVWTVTPTPTDAQPYQVTNFVQKLKASSTSGAGLRDGSETFYWKIWASPKLWSPIDTTESFMMSDIVYGDTVVIPYVRSTTRISYNAAVKLQWGNGPDAWKPAISLDSLVRVGDILAADASGETTADSLFTGRNVFHDWMNSGKGSDRFRLIIAKDTTDAAVTDLGTTNGTGTFQAGVIRRKYKQP